MGLYHKEESTEPIRREKVRTKKKVHKRKARRHAFPMWKLYGIAGVFCVLLAVAGIAAFVNRDADAATLETREWSELGGNGNFSFYSDGAGNNTGGGTPSAAGMTLYYDSAANEYVTYITTEEQLKKVVSGLKWTDDAGTARTKSVTFRLARDLSYTYDFVNSSYAVQDAPQNYQYKSYVYSSGSVFKGDTFDGQGHLIALEYNRVVGGVGVDTGLMILENATASGIYNYGILFARAEDARIENVNITYQRMVPVWLYRDSSSADKSIGVGFGILCGGADNTVFEDISIMTAEGADGEFAFKGGGFYDSGYTAYISAGIGAVIGCMENAVELLRCETDVNVQINNPGSIDSSIKYTWLGAGNIAGQVIGYDNKVTACVNWLENYSYDEISHSAEAETRGSACVYGDIIGLVGSVHGYGLTPDNLDAYEYVGVKDCMIAKVDSRAVGGISEVNFHVKLDNIRYYSDKGDSLNDTWDVYSLAMKRISETDDQGNKTVKNYLEYEPSNFGTKPEAVNSSDVDGDEKNWFYGFSDKQDNELYLLKDHYQLTTADDGTSCDVIFALPNLLNPTGSENIIRVQGILQNWNVEEKLTDNSSVEIYLTTDGSDPRYSTGAKATLKKHSGSGNDAEVITADADSPKFSGTEMTVKARLKVIINGADSDADNDIILWSGLAERTYTEEDTKLDEPILEMKRETDSDYVEFEASKAYALGTTKMKLSVPEGKSFQMYYYFGNKSGMEIGDTDGENTLSLETLKKTLYTSELTLNEEMLKMEDSNRIYLYVLAMTDTGSRYELYEYDIVTFVKDTLMMVTPESGSRIPSGSSVVISVGNGKEAEFPYSQMRVLVSEKQLSPLPSTLDGQTGVTVYSTSSGNGTKDDPWYLEAERALQGDPGTKLYVYVEPIVNLSETHPDGSTLLDTAIDYEQRYSSYVQEYVFTIMSNAPSASLSPTTVKTTESGDPTSIAVDSKIYVTAQKTTDLILYNITGAAITPKLVTDKDDLTTLNGLNGTESGCGTTGQIIYYEDSANSKLYVKCNDIWYEMEDADSDTSDSRDESLRVYKDGDLYFDKTYENQNAYVSVIVFSSGYGYSTNDIYAYYVQEQGAVSAPIALLTSGSSISMNKVLNFSSESGTVIYYTTDGREPQITVDGNGNITPANDSTKLYDKNSGITISEENGFSYGSTATIKMLACPVEDENAATLVFNDKKKCSDAVTFTYEIAEQNQVEAPSSYPETAQDSPAVVKNGDTISLTCQTSGAEIYYTTDGTSPSSSSQKYTGVIYVDGVYGGYYTVKAFACKEGMKDSQVATFVYRIADQDVVGDITATPGTSNTVIAGDKIILSATTTGATIFYTTDGSTPEVTTVVNGDEVTYEYSAPTKKYDASQPIQVPEGKGYFVIHAIAVMPDMADSDVVEFVYTYADEVGAPYGNPSAGTVTANTEVVLKSATKDATIYYEIAYGSEPADPTQASAVFSDKAPIVITKDTVIKAFAVYERESSQIVTLKYTLAEQMQKPTVSVSSGSIVPAGTKITFSVGSGTVYYTTDGSDPSDDQNALVNSGSSMVITGKAGDVVKVNVCTKKPGATTSEVMTLTYQISQYTGGVTADVESGSTVSRGDKIHLSTDVTGGTIYYTTGSGSPLTAGTVGNSVTIDADPGSTVMVKAVAVAPGTEMTGSYAVFQYNLMDQLASPRGSIQNGTILTEETNLVLKANEGKIYYTIDGSEPNKNSYLYEYPIVIYKDMVVKAIAIADGHEDSEVSFFSYTFADKVSSLSASKDSGDVEAGEVIWLTADSDAATIYYTTDGSAPDPDAEEGTFLYNAAEGISVNRNVSIKAIAVQDGLQNSDVLALSYTVSSVPAQEQKLAQQAAEEESGLSETTTENLEDRRLSVSGNGIKNSVVLKDINNGAILNGDEDSLSDKMTLSTKEIAISRDAQESVKNLLGDEYEFLNNYEVTLYLNGKRVQPEGTVEIALPLPEAYQNADVSIIYNNEKGQISVIETRRENGYAYANVSHLKNFGVVGAKLDKNELKNLDLILILTACAAVLAGIGAAMIIRMKKKKSYEVS